MNYPIANLSDRLSNSEIGGIEIAPGGGRSSSPSGIRAIIRLFAALLISASLFGSTQDAVSDTEFLEVLERIAEAEEEVSYTGSRLIVFHTPRGLAVLEDLVIHHPPEVNAVKVLSVMGRERLDKRREMERRKAKDGRERRRSRGDRHLNERRLMPPRKRISNLSQAEMKLLAENYHFHLEPGGDIAGEETNEIKIYPHFEGRPTKRLFISRRNDVILRVEEFDSDGHLRFLSVFTELEFGEEIVEETLDELRNDDKLIFERQERRSQLIEDAEAEKSLDFRLVQPTYLPPGFQLLETRYIKRRSLTVFLRYTDGLATFSLFEREENRKSRHPDRGGHRKWGKTISRHDVPIRVSKQHQTLILEWSTYGVDFTLIGELDSSELIKIAESVILASQKGMKEE